MLGTVGVVQGKDALQDCNAQRSRQGKNSKVECQLKAKTVRLGVITLWSYHTVLNSFLPMCVL